MKDFGFQPKIESIRGIAALNVAITHSMMVFSINGNGLFWSQSIFQLQSGQEILTRLIIGICNGGLSIIIFFMISGFVLGLSLEREKTLNGQVCLKFLVKRIFRIFPAHIVALIFIAGYQIFFLEIRNYENTSQWFVWWFQMGFSGEELLKNSFFYSLSMNHVAWSLRVEFIASLVIPLMYLINRRFSSDFNVVVLLFFLSLAYLKPEYKTLYFLFVFFVGMGLGKYGYELAAILEKYISSGLLILLSFLIMIFPSLFFQSSFSNYLWEVFGATILLSVLQFGNNSISKKILESNIVRALGKMSYSFYLYHFTILYVCAVILLSQLPKEYIQMYPFGCSVLLCISSIILSIPISYLSYKFIEVKSIGLGKRLFRAN
jgi:peptidoglycan/LPS O-acetylase OafA/YrhL